MKNFLAAILLIGTFQLMAQIPTGYYDPAQGLSGDPLKAALNGIIDGHTEYPYSSTSTDVWDILKEADRDPNNANNVLCIYSQFSIPAAPEYDGGNGWNREHVWAKSRGDFGTTLGAGTDTHHLRAADVSTNSARSNRAFAECTDPYTDVAGTYNGPTPAFTSSTEYVWMPPASVKGDVARMIFYMATRYEGANGEPDLELTELVLANTDKTPVHGVLSDLLAWHAADPVDASEQNRNEVIFGYQGNRNPYIDHPEYVDQIWGSGTAAPSFTSSAVTTATENSAYAYNVTATGGQGALSITATTKPTWLTFTDNGGGSATLTGTPGAVDVGNHSVALEVTDGTDITPQNFTITVSAVTGGGGSASDLIFSEYIEGSSYNKALEVANFTGASVNLTGYQIKKQTNGAGSWTAGLSLSGTIADGDVFVVAHSSASATIQAQADLSTGATEMSFNGNDPVALFKDGVLIDVIGTFNSTANYAKDATLVRNSNITDPNATYTTGEWTSLASDTFFFLGSHTMDVGTSNVAPTVSITSPTEAATFTDGDNVTITATASDSDGTVASVEFFVNEASIGTDNASPYSMSYVIGVGSDVLTATATDDQGAPTTSTAVNVMGNAIPNVPPTVSISSPSEAATFTDGDNVTINAAASDSDGTISSIEFFVNGASIGTDNTSPYSMSYVIGVGSDVLTATATDDQAASTTSTAVNVTGQAIPTADPLYFSEYIEGSSFNKAIEIANTSGASVSLTGYILKKQTNGAGSWSTGISLSGAIVDGDVYVVAHSSANAGILAAADFTGANTELTFNGNDALGLFKDGTLTDAIGIFNSASSFGADVTLRRNDNIGTPNVTYTVAEWTTFATDNSAGLGQRLGETVPNASPTVSISSPTEGAIFTDGANVTITASASDSDGTISSVEFFVNGASIGSDNTSPYSMGYVIDVGSDVLTATATDNQAAATTSAAVNVTGDAIPNVPPTVSITAPADASTFDENTVVSIAATASDSDGTISSVEFFVDGGSIGIDNSAPYSINWTIGLGGFVLTTVATDDDSDTTTSSAVNVTGQAVTPPAEVQLSYDNFESGWGNFQDGGSDSKRYTGGTYAYGGNDALNIQDNTNSSVITYTNAVDVSSYNEISVEFFFYPRSMENGEDFWLQFYDGSSWQTVASWARGTDFSNNNFYTSTVIIDAASYSFGPNAKIRFRCDASGNADDVYIDEVTVMATSTTFSGGRSDQSVVVTNWVREGVNELISLDEMELYPNPAIDEAKMLIDADEVSDVRVKVMDIQGRVMIDRTQKLSIGENEVTLDVSGFEAGLYIVVVNSKMEKYIQKLQVR